MLVLIGLIILLFLMSCGGKESYLAYDPNWSPYTASSQQDSPAYYNNYHKYPFTKYSLYGYDDYSPNYRFLWEQDAQNPYHQLKEKEWQLTQERRRLGRPYIQMPSYNHVRQLGYTN